MSVGMLVYASDSYDNILDFNHYINEALKLDNDLDFASLSIICKDTKKQGVHKWLEEFANEFIPCKLIAFESNHKLDGRYARSNRDKLMLKTVERFTAPNKTPILVVFWNFIDPNDSYQYLLHKMIEKCNERGFHILIVDSTTSFSIEEYKIIQETKDNFIKGIRSLEYQFKGQALENYICTENTTDQDKEDLFNW